MIKFIYTAIIALGMSVISSAQTASSSDPDFKTAPAKENAQPAGFKVSVRELEPGTQRFGIAVLNPSGKKLRICIEGKEGEFFQDDVYSGMQVNRVYNLSSLEDGIYKISICRGKEEWTRTIRIATETSTRRVTRNE